MLSYFAVISGGSRGGSRPLRGLRPQTPESCLLRLTLKIGSAAQSDAAGRVAGYISEQQAASLCAAEPIFEVKRSKQLSGVWGRSPRSGREPPREPPEMTAK